MTPTTEEIRERAVMNAYAEAQRHDTPLSSAPEDYELRETGYWDKAKRQLMHESGGRRSYSTITRVRKPKPKAGEERAALQESINREMYARETTPKRSFREFITGRPARPKPKGLPYRPMPQPMPVEEPETEFYQEPQAQPEMRYEQTYEAPQEPRPQTRKVSVKKTYNVNIKFSGLKGPKGGIASFRPKNLLAPKRQAQIPQQRPQPIYKVSYRKGVPRVTYYGPQQMQAPPARAHPLFGNLMIRPAYGVGRPGAYPKTTFRVPNIFTPAKKTGVKKKGKKVPFYKPRIAYLEGLKR